MKKTMILILTFIIALTPYSGNALTFMPSQHTIADTDRHWAESSVLILKSAGIMNGYGGYIYPDSIITRGEFTALITRAFGLHATKYTAEFNDISENHIFYENIHAASEAGIIDGFPDKTFRPDNMITREEIILILSRLRPGDYIAPAKFTDISPDYPYYRQLSAICTDGIINGYPDGSFMPLNRTTRAEAASMIVAAMKKYMPGPDHESMIKLANEYIPQHFSAKLPADRWLTGEAEDDRKYIEYAYTYSSSLGYDITNMPEGLYVSSLEQYGPFTIIKSEYYINQKINGIQNRYYRGESELKFITHNGKSKIFSHNTYVKHEKPINLTWEVFANPPEYDMTGVNTVSPACFVVSASKEVASPILLGSGKSGSLYFNSTLSSEYVSRTKQKGYKIWAMYKTDFTTGTANSFLNNPSVRTKSINILIEKILKLNLDGINFDFENMLSSDRSAYTNHVKEITLISHVVGAAVSVDVTVYMPSSLTWSMCYDRDALSKYSDYIILMAYDQYYSGSAVPGPVAGLGWTEQIIKTTLTEVSPDRLILGMPFYIRYWEALNGKTVSTKAISMQSAIDYVKSNNASAFYDGKHGLTKYTWTKNGMECMLWMENAESIKKRVHLTKQYSLAGVASWRRGFETQDVWDVIAENLN